jgi:hypothetical protein
MIETSADAESHALKIIVLVCTEVVLSIFYMCISKTSMNRIYSLITFVQMLILLLLFETNLPNDIIMMLRELSSFLLFFEF